ncbi:MAG: hypothetical protein OJF49_003138 [Ktedonobacterales bacterium]|nr:MAG: hypothetical protein OJF49_003138 [Ktedonobacterales bacterium]
MMFRLLFARSLHNYSCLKYAIRKVLYARLYCLLILLLRYQLAGDAMIC